MLELLELFQILDVQCAKVLGRGAWLLIASIWIECCKEPQEAVGVWFHEGGLVHYGCSWIDPDGAMGAWVKVPLSGILNHNEVILLLNGGSLNLT